MRNYKAILIGGPTASGKSALAAEIARRQPSVIVNADALQVYSCWRVLSARPTAEDENEFPHLLYGHVACDVRYSVGAWLRDIASALDQAANNQLMPIIVGGTGLYMKALTSGLADIPDIQDEVRRESEVLLRDGNLNVMLNDLSRGDPEIMTKLDQKNPARVARAWEVLRSTGKPLSFWQESNSKPLLVSTTCMRLLVATNTDRLNTNIEARFRRMIVNGAVDECSAYLNTFGRRSVLPSSKALGARQIFDFIEGLCTLETAINSAVVETRQFAKRQRTWMRNQMRDWTLANPDDAANVLQY